MNLKFGLIAASLGAALAASPALAQRVVVNGNPVMFSGQGPIEHNGRVLVPLRGVLEQLGANVRYDSAAREVHAVKNERHIDLPIGSRMATVDGRSVTLDAPARIVNGSTMVPLRFVAESLGAQVNYNSATDTVAIDSGRGGSSNMAGRPMGDRNMRPGMGDMMRGTVVAVHPRQKRIVINERGVQRSIDLMPDYRAQRRTASGDVTIDLSTLQPGDRVELAMRGDQARMVTLMPARDQRMR